MVPIADVRAHFSAFFAAAWLSACAARPLPTPRAGNAAVAVRPEAPAASAVAGSSAHPASEPTLDDSGDSEHDNDSTDDRAEEEEPNEVPSGATVPHPLDGWSDARIEQAVATDLASLGPMSVGTPNAGALVNGVQATPSKLYTLVSPGEAWGTQETLDYLNAAVQAVQDEFPDTPPLALGDIGARHGGPLKPHISHQAGRDLDISFYYRDGTKWYARGTRENLDFKRLWAFVRAIIAKTDIDLILLDHGLQEPLKEYALSIGEDPAWLDQVFQGKGATRAIIRHAPGHATHLHLRFFNPIAQETARRCYPALVRHKVVTAPEQYVLHKAKKNETLAMIAKKYGSTVRAIREANGLHSTLIHDQVSYRVPVSGGVRIVRTERVRIPARRPPPARRATGSMPVSSLSAGQQE
ncbi:MAG TPA: penicillin-insensitive murein endopeptidase [Polyangiaceae bacterium]|jgi:murein endopeptidase|nr:penicillin-insensitive murein endopeptidase [Polyangiaceae bacterium]